MVSYFLQFTFVWFRYGRAGAGYLLAATDMALVITIYLTLKIVHMNSSKKINEFGHLSVHLMNLITEMEQLSLFYEECNTAFAQSIYKNGLQSELKSGEGLDYYETEFACLKK